MTLDGLLPLVLCECDETRPEALTGNLDLEEPDAVIIAGCVRPHPLRATKKPSSATADQGCARARNAR